MRPLKISRVRESLVSLGNVCQSLLPTSCVCVCDVKMAVALNLALTIFILTSVKKPSFAAADSFCFARNYHEVTDEKDSRTCAT